MVGSLEDSKEKVAPSAGSSNANADVWVNDRLPSSAATVGEKSAECNVGRIEQSPGTWQKDAQQALTDFQTLRHLEGQTGQVFHNDQYHDADALRSQLIESADKHFQSALPRVRENAQGADRRMFGKILAVDDVTARKQQAMSEMGLPAGASLNGDRLTNALLNAPDQASLNKLSELAALNDMEALYKRQGGEAVVARHLPSVLGLEYADFLSRYKGGVSSDLENPGQTVTAVNVLDQVRSAESMADPRRQDVANRVGEQSQQHQEQVLPAEKNPLVSLRMAMQTEDPKQGQQLAEKSLQLAQTVDPKDCQNKVSELQKQLSTASPDQMQTIQTQMASWDQLSHARGLAEVYTGYFALQNGDHNKAADHLLKASADPDAVASMTDGRGQPLYDSLLQNALAGGKADLGQTVGDIGTLMQEVSKRSQAFLDGKDEGQKTKDFDAAMKAGEQAIQKASTIRQLGKEDAEKLDKQLQELNKKPETERSDADKEMIKHLSEKKTQYGDLANYQAAAMFSVAGLDAAKGDANASKKLLDDLEKLDCDYLKDGERKKQFDELRSQTNSQLDEQKKHEEHESKNFFGKSWDNVKHWSNNAWDWVKNNGRTVAMVVGAATAVGIGAVCTATGVGAVVGVPLMIAGGALAGTAAGAGAEMAGKKKDNFWSAAWDVAPSAATGAAVGGLTMGTGVAAAGAGAGTAEVAAGTTANVGSKFMMGGIQRGLLIGGASGVPYNLGEVRDKAQSGKYSGFGDAAFDFARGEAMFTATGGSTGLGLKGFLAANAGKNAIYEATNPDGGKLSAGSWATKAALDTGGDFLTGGIGRKFVNKMPGSGIFDSSIPIFSATTRESIHDGINNINALSNPDSITPEMANEMGLSQKELDALKQQSAEEGSSEVAPEEYPNNPYAEYYKR